MFRMLRKINTRLAQILIDDNMPPVSSILRPACFVAIGIL